MSHIDFYAYVLFDWMGIPRWIGKGRGNRINIHETQTDPTNWLKNEFIERTYIVLGELPKLKIRENLTEAEAFETEIALIAAIGRINRGTGPLCNLTNGGEGTSGRIVTEEERRIFSERFKRYQAQFTPEERSERARLREAATLPEVRRARGIKTQAARTPEQRRTIALKMVAAFTNEELTFRLNGNFTFEQRSQRLVDAFARMKPEERSARSRAGGIARFAKLTPEERIHLAREAGLVQAIRFTPEERSEQKKLMHQKRSPEARKETMKKVRDILGPDGRSELVRKAWITRRAKKQMISPDSQD